MSAGSSACEDTLFQYISAIIIQLLNVFIQEILDGISRASKKKKGFKWKIRTLHTYGLRRC